MAMHGMERDTQPGSHFLLNETARKQFAHAMLSRRQRRSIGFHGPIRRLTNLVPTSR